MQQFFEGCETCSHKLRTEPERCFECANAQPSVCGCVHSLGVYFCRVMPQHHTSQWSKGILKFKQGISSIVLSFGRMTAFYLHAQFQDMKPYVLSNVPTWVEGKKQRLFPDFDFGVTRRLAQSAFTSIADPGGVQCHQLLALTGTKKKRQRECRTHAERRHNTKDAYSVITPHQVQDMNIVLLDDVFTTGATMAACTTVLRAAGAQEVVPVVLATTARKREHQILDGMAQQELALTAV